MHRQTINLLVWLAVLVVLSTSVLAKVSKKRLKNTGSAKSDVLKRQGFVLNITGDGRPTRQRGKAITSYSIAPPQEKSKSQKKKNRRPGPQNDLTAKQQKQIVAWHNSYRKRVPGPAADMEEMKWDDKLADMAKQYAKQCVWEHGNPDMETRYHYIGQNLAWSSSNSRQSSAAFMLSLWNNERKYYNILTNQCQEGRMCGHYTQMVWASTKNVGCAMNFCQSMFDPASGTTFKNANYLVCNYGEAGNVVGRKPYSIGEPCSKCESGKGTCRNGLCSDCKINGKDCVCALKCENDGILNDKECACDCAPGFTGSSCQNACNNTHPWCGNGWPKEWCFKYDDANPVETLCPALCGLCECGGPPCQNGGFKNPETCKCECTGSWSGPSCSECNVKCENGQLDPTTCSCDCDDGWAGDTCSGQCENIHQWCWNGWYPNWCDEDHPYVPENCPAMCGLCNVPDKNYDTPDSPCEDKFYHCKWSKSTCDSNRDFAVNYCPLSCGFCSL
ncbi:multiple epidermal growth factor-like domains protein 11 [Anneissia japonica]|uniref:multiple epidermal growth factor-like domains protein 11 n=1 Tax=Anneissia japonica TaxID=1529436 RepID=UPI0014254DCA|nr:multiple epidermal growth factor-like domains protein 11 [Anneissia japonica]